MAVQVEFAMEACVLANIPIETQDFVSCLERWPLEMQI